MMKKNDLQNDNKKRWDYKEKEWDLIGGINKNNSSEKVDNPYKK